MIEITGLDKLSRTLSDAQAAMEGLDGELGTVTFNPRDPASIEAAIHEVERLVDARLGPYATNAIVSPLAEELKQRYREAIVERAASARLDGNQD